MRLERVYPVVDIASWVARLVPVGVRLIQLRVKDRGVEDVSAEIRADKAHCKRFGAQLIVNDYWSLAIDEECGFVHLGQSDLDTADVPAIKAAGLKLGISTHDHAELERALSFVPDYV